MIQWPIHHLFFLLQVRIHLQKRSKATSRKKKQSITLFLFSLTQLSSWRYNTGARRCRLLNLLRTHMRALAVILGSWGHSKISRQANIYFPWTEITGSFWDPFFLLEGAFCCYPFHLGWLSHFLGWCFALYLWWWQFLLSFLLTKNIGTAFMSLCQGIISFCNDRKLLTYDLYFVK